MNNKESIKIKLFLVFFCITNIANAQICKDYITDNWQDDRYTNNGNGTITDNSTGLMWKQCAEGLSDSDCATGSNNTYTWDEALQFHNSSFAGHNDWRLPNVKELFSLAKLNCSNPSINETLFPNTIVDYYWTSSPFKYPTVDNYHPWVVNFYAGQKFNYRSQNNKVRLVRNTNEDLYKFDTNIEGLHSYIIRYPVALYQIQNGSTYTLWINNFQENISQKLPLVNNNAEFNLVAIDNNHSNIFYQRKNTDFYGRYEQYYAYNLSSEEEKIISIGPNGSSANSQVREGVVSNDFNYFAMESCDDNWQTSASSGCPIYIRNLKTDTTIQTSIPINTSGYAPNDFVRFSFNSKYLIRHVNNLYYLYNVSSGTLSTISSDELESY